jgi:hypothetical protein
MNRGFGAAALAGVLTAALLGGCTSPSSSYDDYQRKATHTADEIDSLAQTALLAARTSSRGNATGPYLQVVISTAEDDAGQVQNTFESVQPPDRQSDTLRTKLLSLLNDVGDVLTKLRVAVKRGELDRLAGIAAPLTDLTKRLEDFSEANG